MRAIVLLVGQTAGQRTGGSRTGAGTGRPTFSVIIPTYARPALLELAIAGVQRQTRPDWELIVVDDGSPEPAVVPADPRIRLVRLRTNGGPARARNVGVEHAVGEILLFCDDDDTFEPQRLDMAAEGMTRAPVAVCWARFVDGPAHRGRRLDGWVGDTILDGPTPSLGATAVRRDAFVPFDERWSAIEDVDWWRRTAHLHPVATVGRHGYLVRRHDGARARNDLAARIAENRRYLATHTGWFAAHPTARAFRLRRIGLLLSAAGRRREARSAFAQSMRARPNLRTVRHLVTTAWVR